MKQIFQDPRTAEITIAEVPAPKLLAGCLLLRTAASLVSAGTERASSEFAGKNLVQKARMRPDLVRDVLSKMGRDGLLSTIAAVRNRLDQPSTPGYSSAGTVMAVGEGVREFSPGDRVACAGAGHATHAEFACVPQLLAARIPSDEVNFDSAAFTTVGAVALHGVRTAAAQLGDTIAVIGLGLLGQLAVQILKAAGCRVLGMDLSAARADLALRCGADAVSTSATEFIDLCLQYSAGHGADAVLIAAQTSSNEPVNLAGAVARNRAIVAAVGDVAMDIPRRTFYEKELDFRISRSYGPGRYDAAYEQKGIDYPIGYVRWTETRNMEAFLQLLAERKLNLDLLITHRFPIARGREAYELITGETREAFLGVVIQYPADACDARVIQIQAEERPGSAQQSVRIGLLGAGNFAGSTLLPAIKRAGETDFVVACAANGSHAQHVASKFGFRSCTTEESEVIDNSVVNTVVICTRHHLHAAQTLAALNAGKHVFCEKPLCLNAAELAAIVAAYENQRQLLMVGFNRRFAPMAVRLKGFLHDLHEPLAIHYRVNAGFLPQDHWLNDPEQGGGRVVGEVCHFVDFLCFLTGAAPLEVETRSLADSGRYSNDNVVCSLRFSDGSLGTITYLANGDKSFSKERVEIFGGGAAAVLEDFRSLELVRNGRKHVVTSRLRQDKGHQAEWQAFASAMRNGGHSPISIDEIIASMLATFALEESRCLAQPVKIRQTAAFRAEACAALNTAKGEFTEEAS
ncbi:MAG TPA: bi-domain-containing oxidoreductase [Candidatus Binatia bacterium]|nr:bi-domain-containing oxidoreductase [Candidatus Binatia bacterium]